MSDAPRHLDAARPVPGWPRRWLVLLSLHDYLLGDALVLPGFWLRNRRAFWQYIMKVEDERRVREAVLRGGACWVKPEVKIPERGAWRIE